MAGFFFALMTFFVRLSGELPTMEKAFFRNAVAAVIAWVTLLRSGETYRPTKETVPDLFWRSLCGTLGLICNFYAIDKLNIADANILNKLSPFFAILMSAILLKEKANKTEWFCVFLAFTGALFVIKPSFQMQSVYALIGMLGGLGAGTAYTFGNGVETDFRKALLWYRKAAAQGDTRAMSAIGDAYGTGNGVEQDGKEALRWYKAACSAGSKPACGFAESINPETGNLRYFEDRK